MRWSGHVARIGENRNAYNILAREPEKKRLLGIRKWRWEDNIEMDLRVTVLEVVGWIYLVQHRDQWWALVKTVMKLWVS